jgi:hypothetical protein
MANRKPVFLLAAAVAAVAALLWLWTRFAELWAPSVAFYAGVVITVVGLAGVLAPKRWASPRKWTLVGRWIAAGVAICGLALLWPADYGPLESAGSTELDKVLPAYDRAERHQIVVPVSCGQARAAAEQVAFTDIRGLQALLSLRAGKRVKMQPRPLLATMTGPNAGFSKLASTEQEFVAGNAGRPWAGEPTLHFNSAGEYRAFNQPGYAKVAFNLRYEPGGPSACTVSSETRILATDPSARAKFTRYWKVIYPGSALIRVLWLDAIERRLLSSSNTPSTT